MQLNSVFDMASVTKIFATTICLMKLYDEGKLDLNKTLGDYLPWVRGTNKEKLGLRNILTHQAGLISFIPFYKEIIDTAGYPSAKLFGSLPDAAHTLRVAENLYMRNDWADTMYKRILQSPLEPKLKYVYSDNDFIFLGKIIEQVTGKTLDAYAAESFYQPMSLHNTGFKPRERLLLNTIVPTEAEKQFRRQQLLGDVHDPGAAMFGGVAGHAGLFSNSYELAAIGQMLLNGGTLSGKRYIKKETIELFTAYHSDISRRGYGFDKPEKPARSTGGDNATRPEPYPCLSASPLAFGHTGYTGTCVWVDPKYDIVFVFLSNRVQPNGGDNRKLLDMNIRGKIHETIYKAMGL